jgi:hypothetical protein
MRCRSAESFHRAFYFKHRKGSQPHELPDDCVDLEIFNKISKRDYANVLYVIYVHFIYYNWKMWRVLDRSRGGQFQY